MNSSMQGTNNSLVIFDSLTYTKKFTLDIEGKQFTEGCFGDNYFVANGNKTLYSFRLDDYTLCSTLDYT